MDECENCSIKLSEFSNSRLIITNSVNFILKDNNYQEDSPLVLSNSENCTITQNQFKDNSPIDANNCFDLTLNDNYLNLSNIYIEYSPNQIITNNEISYGTIGLIYSPYSYVSNNTVTEQSMDRGISLGGCSHSIIYNNTCGSIYLGSYDTYNCSVLNNTIYGEHHWYSLCHYGIELWNSFNCTIMYNTLYKFREYGIWVWQNTKSSVIAYNLIQESQSYGIYLGFQSSNMSIHHNTFINNNIGGLSQGNDNGTGNYWYDTNTLEGNYWSDWSGEGFYSIDGAATNFDLYPLTEPLHTPIISEFKPCLFVLILIAFTPILMMITHKTKKTKYPPK